MTPFGLDPRPARGYSEEAVAAQYRWDDFVLDLDGYRLERAHTPLSLEPKAFNLLVLMVQRPGHLFSKQEIFDAIWPHTAVTDHALTRVVAQLRRVLGDEAREGRYIETVPTRGYRWIPLVNVTEGPAAPDQRAREAMRARVPDQVPSAPVTSVVVGPAAAARHGRLPALTAVLGLAAIVVVLLVALQRNTPTSATGVNEAGSGGAAAGKTGTDLRWPVQLTTHAGLDLQPALSPQGDAVALVSDRTGALEIHIRGLGGASREAPLTSDGGQNVQPAWSPDGRFIAYHSARGGGIWVIPARGGTPRQIAPTGSNPSWSPDGLRVAFESDEHADVAPNAFGAQSGSTIWMADADGGHLQPLTRSGEPIGGHASPTWSNDGRYIGFTVFEAGSGNGAWLLNLATRKTTPLDLGGWRFEMVFAPDNSAVYVAGGEAIIVRLPFDAATGTLRGPRELIPVPGVPGVRGLSISADSRRLVFAGLALSSQIWAQPIGRDGSAAGPAKALTSDTSRRNSLPSASPNGSKVAYMSTRSGEGPNVWVMDADGRNSVQVTSNADWQPTWFPDGKRLGYLSNRGETAGLWSVDLTTRREELLFDIGQVQHVPPPDERIRGRLAEVKLSPSMTRAAFSLIAPPAGRRVLYVSGIDRFAPRALTDGTSSVGYPAWSPDERQIAVEIKDGSSTHAGVIDVQTGSLRQLTTERGQTWVRSWSPDGRRLAVATLRDGVWGLQWIDVASGRQGVITPPGPPRVYLRYPEWSPRGSVVLFERGELRGNIWMLTLP